MISTVLQDLRFAVRQLRKTPGFTATAVLTLALGIGANAAIFTLVNAVMMKSLPVAEPERLVKLGDEFMCCVGFGHRDDGDYALFSTAVYEHIKKNAPEFEELAAMQAGYLYRPVVVRRGDTNESARSVMGEFVSGNYFRTFGLRPSAGRLFSDADDVQGAPIVAVMSYETWKNSYSGDRSVVGSTFYVNTKPVTIAGIAPEGFFGDRLSSAPPDFYLPIESMPPLANVPYVHDPDGNWLYMIGRLKPGVSQVQLQAKLSGLLRQALATTHTYSSKDSQSALARAHLVLTPGGAGVQLIQEEYVSHLKLLMWCSGLVLLIACANIANLLLARGMGRKAEMSVRTALGAMRYRIVRQLLTESLLLAGLGGLAGLAVAYAGTKMLLALAFPDAAGLPIHASPPPQVIAFACGLSLLTGVLFGVAPAWMAAQAQPVEALRSGSRTTGGATLLQRSLVVVQAALSLVLLVGAGLFAQSLNKLQQKDLKLESENRYIVHFNPQAAGYSQRQLGGLYRAIEDQFHAMPGVEKVGIATYTPMEDNNDSWSVRVEGKPDLNVSASGIRVSPEYFDSVGTHVLLGRGIGIQDTATSPTVAVVNETFVKKWFRSGENPVGHYFGGGEKDMHDYQIVGVVEDTIYTDVRWTDHLMAFFPLLQRPVSDERPIEDDELMYVGAFVLQTTHPMPDMETLTRRTLSQINPNLAVVKFQTFNQQIADQFTDDRMLARLTMLFGVLALLLATLGLYGVSAYTVARRTSEIGIRMALGAERSKVTAMIMRGAAIQAALGLAIGLPLAWLSMRFVKAQLYEVKGIDAAVLLASVLTLALAASMAAFIPARRAASIDPAKALRTE
ncbi:MAG TPA: ABC transporter permease [Candidatus Sulfotelmatobacter sp.]|nr:ABC transporter permease [Candidatus Sulfotelmatobacter sp.]